MAIGTVIHIEDLDRTERLLLVAAFQRAGNLVRRRDREVEEAIELLLQAALDDHKTAILTVVEAGLAFDRLVRLLDSTEPEPPEIVDVARKAAAMLEAGI